MAATAQAYWFVGRTRFGQEVGIRRRLEALGVENYIPTQLRENSRGKKVERAVVNNLVFLRTTKNEACALANDGIIPVRYIVDCATRTLMVVPDKQMEDFRRVMDLGTEEGGLIDRPLALGDHVRVIKGALKGVEGHVIELHGKFYVVVSLADCLFAKARVPRAWLEKVTNK